MKKLTDEWIHEHQDKYLCNKLEKVKNCLSVASVVFGILYVWLRRQSLFLTIACLLIPLTCVVLDICLPAYFTLAYTKAEMRKNDRVPRISLTAPFFWSLGLLAAATVLNLHFVSIWKLLLSGLLFGAAVALAFVLFLPEFRSDLRAAALPLVILLVSGFGVTGQANYWLDMSEPEIVAGEVVAIEENWHNIFRRKGDVLIELTGTQYTCTIQLPDGTQAEFAAWSSEDILIGDQVPLNRIDGFLGLECYFLGADKPNIRK